MGAGDGLGTFLVALLVLALLVLVMRWVFKPSRPRRPPPVDASDATELGLLTVVATVARAEANERRAVLGSAGIRSSASARRDGRVDLLVFHGDADLARRLLGVPGG